MYAVFTIQILSDTIMFVESIVLQYVMHKCNIKNKMMVFFCSISLLFLVNKMPNSVVYIAVKNINGSDGISKTLLLKSYSIVNGNTNNSKKYRCVGWYIK